MTPIFRYIINCDFKKAFGLTPARIERLGPARSRSPLLCIYECQSAVKQASRYSSATIVLLRKEYTHYAILQRLLLFGALLFGEEEKIETKYQCPNILLDKLKLRIFPRLFEKNIFGLGGNSDPNGNVQIFC